MQFERGSSRKKSKLAQNVEGHRVIWDEARILEIGPVIEVYFFVSETESCNQVISPSFIRQHCSEHRIIL
jgi:hypothetical protein